MTEEKIAAIARTDANGCPDTGHVCYSEIETEVEGVVEKTLVAIQRALEREEKKQKKKKKKGTENARMSGGD